MPVIEIPEIGPVEFPSEMTTAEIEQAAGELYDEKLRSQLKAAAPHMAPGFVGPTDTPAFLRSPIDQQIRQSELKDAQLEAATTVPPGDESGTLARMRSAFARGSAQLSESLNRAIGGAMDWVGSSPVLAVFRTGPGGGPGLVDAMRGTGDYLTDTANQVRQTVKDISLVEQATPAPAVGRAAADIAGGVPSLVTTVATAPVAGLPILMAGLQSYGSVLGSAEEGYRNQGLPEDRVREKAREVAALNGVGTALLTFGFNRFGPSLEKWTEGLAGAPSKTAIGSMLKSFGFEASEEGIDQLAQGITARASYDPSKSWDSIVKESLQAAVAGGVIAFGAKGAAIADENGQLIRELNAADPNFDRWSKDVADRTAAIASLPPAYIEANPVAAKTAVAGAPATAAAIVTSEETIKAVTPDATPETVRIPVDDEAAIEAQAELQSAKPKRAKKTKPGQPVRASVDDLDAIEQQAIAQEQAKAVALEANQPAVDSVSEPVPAPPAAPISQPEVKAPIPEIPQAIKLVGKNELARRAKLLVKHGWIGDVPEDHPKDAIALVYASQLTQSGRWNPQFEEDVKLGAKKGDVVVERPQSVVAEPAAAAEPSFTELVSKASTVTNDELSSYKGQVVGGATGYMWDLGSKAKTPEDVAALKQMAEESSAKVKELVSSGDLEGAMAIAGRQPAEAYEFATGVTLSGEPKWQIFEKRIQGYKPSVPDPKYIAAKNLPDWARDQMVQSGLDPARQLNDIDLGNKSVVDAVKSDPTLTEEQKQRLLSTGSSQPGPGSLGIVAPGTQLTMDTLANPNWWDKNFTANRGLPPGVMDEWQKRMGSIRAEGRMATYAARDLANALRKMYNIGRVESAAWSGLSKVPRGTLEAIQSALTGGTSIDSLPEPLRGPVSEMRLHVDALSQELVDTLGEDNELSATIQENLGTYLNRSYRIFDDKNWVKKIPVDIRNNAEAFLAEQLAGDDGVITEENRQEARRRLAEMLADWSDAGLDTLMRKGKLGSKDVSLFMKRKDIAPEIRAVMGEYGDPVTNYIRSITKMSRWLGDHEFLTKVKELGMGNWLFKEGDTSAPKGFDHRIAADSSNTMSPLNGLRTSAEIKQIFEEFNKNNISDNQIARMYFMLNAWSRQAKTVWSALTQARNLIGNPFFNIKSGHWNFSDYGKAIQAQWADIGGNNADAQLFYAEMAKYGLVDENPVVSDLKKAIEDSGLQDPSFEDYSSRGIVRAIRSAVSVPQRAYRLPDEMGKTVGWLGEINDLQKSHPDWSETQVKEEAAKRIRNEYPTYSMLPEAIQQFRKQPFIGPFVNFAYETIRNGYHTLLNGSSDLAQGFASGNKPQRNHGAKKLAGFASVLGSGFALSFVSRLALQMRKEDEDDMRRFMPEWSKNAELVHMAKEGTKHRFVNYSYLNPYSQMTDPFVAALNKDNKGVLDKSVAALGEVLKPFTNEQMLAGAIAEVVQNEDQNGRPIYNEQDDADTKFNKSAARILKSLEPGTLERLKSRIIPAIMGEPTPSGEKRDPALEIFSEIFGLRMDQIDLTKAFGFKMRNYDESLDDARRLLTSVAFQAKGYTPEQGLEAYRKADDARFRIWQSIYEDTAALFRQGAEVKEVRDGMKASGMSDRDANAIIAGAYIPMEFVADDFRRARKMPDHSLLSAIGSEREARSGKRLDER